MAVVETELSAGVLTVTLADEANRNALGSQLVRELVAAHGGRIAALPTPRGAHFRMELPRGC